ncbi:MAG TPA: flagellar biosynthesis anti-sigma factor FlgM [Clostridiales bacterium UBA8153]|nr:flagellar biosynthesis anti-sigma factor FlgM [Clostridiales bacterium UBA8153]
MIISRSQIGQTVQAYSDQLRGRTSSAAPLRRKAGHDQVALSPEASRLAEARRLLKSIPDVRAERVSELTQAISRGEYRVSGHDIAEKMCGRLLVDRIK